LHVYSDPASERHVNSMAGVEAPERFPAALAGVEEAKRAGVPVEHRPCQPAPTDALEAAHAPRYLQSLEELSARGGGYVDFDTGLSPNSWEATTLAAGAAVGAAESALEGTVAFAVARPPGHHAGRDYGMGFCLINNAAVAAEYARSRGLDRVAILDWDVHHGNGTQDIFYGSGEVLYLSAHQSPFYPGTGDARDVGKGRGEGFTANVPLPGRSGEDLYAEAFAGFFIPILREFRPALILVSAGYDAHTDDLLGGMRLTADSFGRFACALAAVAREVAAAPPAFLLEGGYNLNALTDSVAATIKGAKEEGSPAWEYSGDASPVEAARKALSPFWESLR
jgi:acetoin utilization deacetylase AcuC-like enzyme